ncbi:MAG: hypothetical protein ATN35_03255 [Epulopiscium sp. Nele67-Bin004]|nr:MAG: hypothetical protein ATN35_03255 [Epulopiscium sp. Nele67-Bin004]
MRYFVTNQAKVSEASTTIIISHEKSNFGCDGANELQGTNTTYNEGLTDGSSTCGNTNKKLSK